MLMTEIPKYIELRGKISLLELARHFNLQESAIQQMLTFWIRKGKITQLDTLSSNCTSNSKCNDCSHCNDSSNEIYIWNDAIKRSE